MATLMAPASKKKKVEEDTSPLITLTVTKQQRLKDEKNMKVYKWNFTEPSGEFVEQLKLQMEKNFSKTMMDNLFHSDFKFHIKAIEALIKCLDTLQNEQIGNLDLILKWFTLRFFDTIPSMLNKGLEYLQALFAVLADNDYQLNDLEANSFMPYLMIKVGENKDNVRRDVRNLFKLIYKVFPVSKMFTFISDGIKSKNSKQRTECLEELGYLIETYGISICQPTPGAALKTIAAQISDRDNRVRNAALNTTVVAYMILGDNLYKYIGNLKEKDQSFLDERIKRSSKNRPPPGERPKSAPQGPQRSSSQTTIQRPQTAGMPKSASSNSMVRKEFQQDIAVDKKTSNMELPKIKKERMASANEDLFSSPVNVRPSEYQRIRDNIPQASTPRHTFETNNHVSAHRASPPDSPRNTSHDNFHLLPEVKSQSSHIANIDQPPYRNPHRHINHDSHNHYARRDQISPREPKTHQSHDHYMRRDQISPREPKSHQLESIKSAADAIIRDKDARIDDLRRQLVGQEETIKEYENKQKDLEYRYAQLRTQVPNLKYRYAQLRTLVANLRANLELQIFEIEELEIKMGGVEHEVVEPRAALRKSQANLAETQDKLQQKDRETEEWKDKFTGLKESTGSLKEQIDSLERYIADLPAPGEFGKTADELAAYKEENQLKKEQIESLEERLKETTEPLSEKEITAQDLENKQQHLATKKKELTTEIQYIKSEGEGRAQQQAQEDLQKLLEEALEVKERVYPTHLFSFLEKAKKMSSEVSAHLTQLQERLQQEEESVVALREEGRMKEQQMGKLMKSLEEFAGKIEDLMDENLILKDHMKQHEAMIADENQKLVSEMSICFSELQFLVQIIVQMAEGKQPDISLLLGMAGTTLEEEQGAVGGAKKDDTMPKHWFKKLKELRLEVKKIRKMICDKCANILADNINCAPQ